VSGAVTEEALQVAASLCARYSDAKEVPDVKARVTIQKRTYNIRIARASNEVVDALRIEKKQRKKVTKA
jgi:hypothetical protein